MEFVIFLALLAVAIYYFFFRKKAEKPQETNQGYKESEWEYEQFKDVRRKIVDAGEKKDTSALSGALDELTDLMKRYPDYPDPYIFSLRVSISFKKLDLAEETYSLIMQRFSSEPKVIEKSADWRRKIDKLRDSLGS